MIILISLAFISLNIQIILSQPSGVNNTFVGYGADDVFSLSSSGICIIILSEETKAAEIWMRWQFTPSDQGSWKQLRNIAKEDGSSPKRVTWNVNNTIIGIIWQSKSGISKLRIYHLFPDKEEEVNSVENPQSISINGAHNYMAIAYNDTTQSYIELYDITTAKQKLDPITLNETGEIMVLLSKSDTVFIRTRNSIHVYLLVTFKGNIQWIQLPSIKVGIPENISLHGSMSINDAGDRVAFVNATGAVVVKEFTGLLWHDVQIVGKAMAKVNSVSMNGDGDRMAVGSASGADVYSFVHTEMQHIQVIPSNGGTTFVSIDENGQSVAMNRQNKYIVVYDATETQSPSDSPTKSPSKSTSTNGPTKSPLTQSTLYPSKLPTTLSPITNKENNGLSTLEISLICASAAIVILLAAIFFVCCCAAKKKQKKTQKSVGSARYVQANESEESMDTENDGSTFAIIDPDENTMNDNQTEELIESSSIDSIPLHPKYQESIRKNMKEQRQSKKVQ